MTPFAFSPFAFSELRGADREAHREVQAVLWEEKLERAARALGVRTDRLPAGVPAAEQAALAALMKAGSSVANGWLAERLGISSAGNLSQLVRRFRLRGATEQRSFKAALSQVMT